MKDGKTGTPLAVMYAVAVFAFASVPPAEPSPSYYCYRADTPIRIDGQLDEEAWEDVPWISCRGFVDGSAPRYSTKVKLLWDDANLYVGFDAEEPNVWAVVGKDTEEPGKMWTVSAQAGSKFIMLRDSFLEVFLDPDGDGKNYMEFHVNAAGNVNDMWLGHGSTRKDRQELDMSPRNLHLEWDCGGLETAVRVHGTLNKPEDSDRGWSVEMAFPWASLSRFTIGRCPPAAGDAWRAQLARAYRADVGGNCTYWTWPVVGVFDCHQLDRYGYVIFSGGPAIKRQPVKRPLEWKMVWLWSIKDKSDAEIVSLAKSLGFNAIQARSENMIQECHKVGMEAIAALWFGSAPEEFSQLMLPEEQERMKKQMADPTLKNLYQSGGEPVQGGQVHINPRQWCLDRAEALEYGKRRIDGIIEAGYDGIAFDAIGYANYWACFCPVSRRKHEEFAKNHPELSREEAIRRCSEQCLVSFYDSLVGYARKKQPDIRTTCHVYPDFAPDPLYGKKLPVDYCGQTVSWFFVPHWPLDKVERYAYEVAQYESQFHPGSGGAPFIGIYTLPPDERHRKSAERVRQEIRIVKQSGARAIQLAELGHILNDPEIAEAVSEELGGTWKPGQ